MQYITHKYVKLVFASFSAVLAQFLFPFRNFTMSLLFLLPVALAGLPPHHQKLVDRFGADNVNFDKNVRIIEKISRYTE